MAPPTGYWGPPSSSIDWCEANYSLTPYVAEFANSVSSLVIVAAGLLPLALHRELWPWLEPRFLMAFLSVAVVGLGSVAFHGTLLFEHQLLDEVPMLWTVVVVLYLLLEQHTLRPCHTGLPAALASYAALATLATSWQTGLRQWLSFHTLFAACELSALALVVRFLGRLSTEEAVAPEPALRRLLRRGLWAYVLGILAWLLDLYGCWALRRLPLYDAWNLHAFGWHPLTSYGLYSMLLGLWYHRLKRVREVPVTLVGNLLPRIALKRDH